MHTITRNEFREVVEAAIEASLPLGFLSAEAKHQLRLVACTTPAFVVGTTEYLGYQCPAAQAGLRIPAAWGMRFDRIFEDKYKVFGTRIIQVVDE